jgi:hypothetical protein
MPFDMSQMKKSGIVSGNEIKRAGNWWEEDDDDPREKEQEFQNWLSRREQKIQPNHVALSTV